MTKQDTLPPLEQERAAFEAWYAALPNNGRKAGLTLLDAWQARASIAQGKTELQQLIADNAGRAAFLDSHPAVTKELCDLIEENERLKAALAAQAPQPEQKPLADELLLAAKSAITCSYADHGRRSVNLQAWDRLIQAVAVVAHGTGTKEAAPQQAQGVAAQDTLSVVRRFERMVGDYNCLFTEYQCKAMPTDVYQRFTALREERIPTARKELAAMLAAAPQAAPAPESDRNDPVSALAIRLLVAAGHVSQEAANEAFHAACTCLEAEARKMNVSLPWVMRPPQAAPAPEVPSSNFVQPVPDHCDRITWRGHYMHLKAPTPQALTANQMYEEGRDGVTARIQEAQALADAARSAASAGGEG